MVTFLKRIGILYSMNDIDSSRELPVALNVYTSTGAKGEFFARAGDYHEPALIFDPFYARCCAEFKEIGADLNDRIGIRIAKRAKLSHLTDIADLLDNQSGLFSVFDSKFMKFYHEKELPAAIVEDFFRRDVSRYNRFAFAQQSDRLGRLAEVSGSQNDLLAALGIRDVVGYFEQLTAAYARIEKAALTFSYATLNASESYDKVANKFFLTKYPDLMKFGLEPEINAPEQNKGTDFGRVISSLQNVAQDPVFVAGIRRRRAKAFGDISKLAEKARRPTGNQ